MRFVFIPFVVHRISIVVAQQSEIRIVLVGNAVSKGFCMEHDLKCPGTGGLCPHRRPANERSAAIEGVPVCDFECASWVAERVGKEVYAVSSSSRLALDMDNRPPEAHFRMRRSKPQPKKHDDDPAWSSRFDRLELPLRIARKRRLEGW